MKQLRDELAPWPISKPKSLKPALERCGEAVSYDRENIPRDYQNLICDRYLSARGQLEQTFQRLSISEIQNRPADQRELLVQIGILRNRVDYFRKTRQSEGLRQSQDELSRLERQLVAWHQAVLSSGVASPTPSAGGSVEAR